MFYNPRLDAAEEGRLYTSYRSEEYQRARQDSEIWYTKAFNAELASPSSYELRRRTLGALIRPHMGEREIRRVLDYGGDQGDLVNGLFDGAEAFVYDISGIPAAEGVTSTRDPSECRADLIINSNVLEHVGFPRLLVRDMINALPAGSLVFLEVPFESPFGLARIARRATQIGIMALIRPTLARSVVRPASLFMMHEHINYFTEQSLTTLMLSSDSDVVAAGRYFVDETASKGEMVWCLGRAKYSSVSPRRP